MGYPKMNGSKMFKGKNPIKMDDLLGYPYDSGNHHMAPDPPDSRAATVSDTPASARGMCSTLWLNLTEDTGWHMPIAQDWK